MEPQGTSVTLIFYKVGRDWWREPALNLLAAAAQGSAFTHVEIAIGETAGAHGEMVNVARVFNDNVGVELCSRTGRNPSYSYLSVGCSHEQADRMLLFARSCVGKPFSNVGMARSVLFPRTSDYTSFFCAELTAAVLKRGGLLHADSNPGAATPSSLYKLYLPQAAATGNPFKIRQLLSGGLGALAGPGGRYAPLDACAAQPPPPPQQQQQQQQQHRHQQQRAQQTFAPWTANVAVAAPPAQRGGSMRRSESPPRAPFRLLSSGLVTHASAGASVGLSLTSLSAERRR